MHPSRTEATAQAHLRNAIHDLAKREAQRLRRAAIDDFWRGADAVWQRSLAGGQALAYRSAARLKARLARRTQRLATPSTKA